MGCGRELNDGSVDQASDAGQFDDCNYSVSQGYEDMWSASFAFYEAHPVLLTMMCDSVLVSLSNHVVRVVSFWESEIVAFLVGQEPVTASCTCKWSKPFNAAAFHLGIPVTICHISSILQPHARLATASLPPAMAGALASL